MIPDDRAQKFISDLKKVSSHYNVPLPTLIAVANQESQFNQSAAGSAGEIGLMQILPGTVPDIGGTADDLQKPWHNFIMGAKYMSVLRDKYGAKDTLDMLGGYNAGPNAIKGKKYAGIKSTDAYIKSITNRINLYKTDKRTYASDLVKLYYALEGNGKVAAKQPEMPEKVAEEPLKFAEIPGEIPRVIPQEGREAEFVPPSPAQLPTPPPERPAEAVRPSAASLWGQALETQADVARESGRATRNAISNFVTQIGNMVGEGHVKEAEARAAIGKVLHQEGFKDVDPLLSMKLLAKTLTMVPQQIWASHMTQFQGWQGATVLDRDWADRQYQKAREGKIGETAKRWAADYKGKKFLPGVKVEELPYLAAEIGYSVSLWPAAIPYMAAQAVTGTIPVVGQILPPTIAMVTAGGLAYNMSSYAYMQEFLEAMNDQSIADRGRPITKQEENKLKREFAGHARAVGLWEAGPEAFGSVLGVTTAVANLSKFMPKGMAIRILTKVAAMYGIEIGTEMVSQVMQSPHEVAASLREGKPLDWQSPTDWITALKEVAPRTALLVTMLGGLGAGVEIRREVTKDEILETFREEVPKDQPHFQNLQAKLERQPQSIALELRMEEYMRGEREAAQARAGVTPAGRRAEEMPIAAERPEEIPAEVPPEAPAPTVAPEEAAPPTPLQPTIAETRQPWEMTQPQIEQAYEDEKARDLAAQKEVLGDDYRRYRVLLKQSESFDPDKMNKAQDELDAIEARLTEEEKDRLWGKVGEEGYTPEEWREFARAVGNLDFGSPEDLGWSLQWAITDIGDATDPATMTWKEKLAYTAISHAYDGIMEKGWNPDEVWMAAVKNAASRFGSFEDALFMLRRYVRRPGEEAAAPRPVPELPAPEDRVVEAVEQPPRVKRPREEVKATAQELADRANEEIDAARGLYRDVMERGGIRPETYEEFQTAVPPHWRRKAGLPADEMAAELKSQLNYDFDTADEMFQAIAAAERTRKQTTADLAKGKTKYTAADFSEQAKEELQGRFETQIAELVDQMDDQTKAAFATAHDGDVVADTLGYVLGRTETVDAMVETHGAEAVVDAVRAEIENRALLEGEAAPEMPPTPAAPPGEMFPGLRRELTGLEAEDMAAGEEDPLMIHMLRKGWSRDRIREIQDSIANKSTPNMFTGETEPLTAGELEYQRDVQEFLDRQAGAETVAAEPEVPREEITGRLPISEADVGPLIEHVDEAAVRGILSVRGTEGFSDEAMAEQLGRAIGKSAEMSAKVEQFGASAVLDEIVNQVAAEPEPMSDLEAWRKIRAQELSERLSEEQQAGFVRMRRAEPQPEIQDPAVRDALYAGRKQTSRFGAFGRRMGDLFWTAVHNPAAEFEPELKKAGEMQFRDDYRTGALPAVRRAVERTEIAFGSIWGDLTRAQRDTVLNILGLQDFVESGGEGLDNPNKVTEQQALDELNRIIAQVSEKQPEILEAVERYHEYTRLVADDLVMRGKMPADAARWFYLPHRVIDYLPEWYTHAPFRPRRVRAPYRYYTKERIGSVKDIAINEEALYSHFATVEADNIMDDWALKMIDKYDIVRKMKTADRQALFGKGKGPTPKKPYDVAGKRYIGFQYVPGRVIYKAEAADLRLLKIAIEDAMEEAAVEAVNAPDVQEALRRVRNLDSYDDIRNYLSSIVDREGPLGAAAKSALKPVLAIGKYRKTVLLPEAIYNKMMKFKDPYGGGNAFINELARFHTYWKALTLSPAGAGLPFHMGNLFGDGLNLFRTSEGALKETVTAGKIIYKMKPERRATMTPFEERVFQASDEKDVLGSGYFLEYSLLEGKPLKKGPWHTFWHGMEKFNGVREGWLRLAMLAYQMKRIEAGLPVRAPGFEKAIKGLDPISQAAYVARNFSVDYLAVPDAYRRYVRTILFPFGTFWQKNAVNWARYMVEAPQWFGLKFLGPHVAAYMWNNSGDREEVEVNLPAWITGRWHWIVKINDTDKDGVNDEVWVYAPQQPLDMAMQFTGVHLIPDKINMVKKGLLTPEEAAKLQLWDMGLATPTLFHQLLGPMIQIIEGIPRGKDPRTGQQIVPPELADIPEYQKLRYYTPFVLEKLATPFGQYMRAARTNEKLFGVLPKLEDIPAETKRYVFDGPLDVVRGLGLYKIDLRQAEAWKLMEAARRSKGEWAKYMHRLEVEYLESDMSPEEFLVSEKARRVIGDAARRNLDIRSYAVDRITSPRVQIEAVKKQILNAQTKEEKERLENNLDMLLMLRAMEYATRIPRGSQIKLIEKLQKQSQIREKGEPGPAYTPPESEMQRPGERLYMERLQR